MEIGEVIGIVSTLVNAWGGMYGKTTISPAYAFNTWRNDNWGIYANVPFGVYAKVYRDAPTGAYFYLRKMLQPDGTFRNDDTPFPIVSLRRLSYRCDRSYTNAQGVLAKTVYNQLEDFNLIVFHASPVIKTGMFPPGAPYQLWIKAGATPLASNCTPVAAVPRDIRQSVELYETGFSVATFVWMNFDYGSSFVVWAGEFYEH